MPISSQMFPHGIQSDLIACNWAIQIMFWGKRTYEIISVEVTQLCHLSSHYPSSTCPIQIWPGAVILCLHHHTVTHNLRTGLWALDRQSSQTEGISGIVYSIRSVSSKSPCLSGWGHGYLPACIATVPTISLSLNLELCAQHGRYLHSLQSSISLNRELGHLHAWPLPAAIMGSWWSRNMAWNVSPSKYAQERNCLIVTRGHLQPWSRQIETWTRT